MRVATARRIIRIHTSVAEIRFMRTILMKGAVREIHTHLPKNVVRGKIPRWMLVINRSLQRVLSIRRPVRLVVMPRCKMAMRVVAVSAITAPVRPVVMPPMAPWLRILHKRVAEPPAIQRPVKRAVIRHRDWLQRTLHKLVVEPPAIQRPAKNAVAEILWA